MPRPPTAPTTPPPSSVWPSPRPARPSPRRSGTRSARCWTRRGRRSPPGRRGGAGFKKGLGLLKEGKPIRYVGVIGPVQFDKYGDITGPFRLWRIKDGEVGTTGEMAAGDVDQLKAKLGD